MTRLAPHLLLLALLGACGWHAAHASAGFATLSPRLREKRLHIPTAASGGVGEGVPIVDPPVRTAGYFKLDRTYAAEMFYFFFQARHNPSRAPLVIWMTGGPGCSSELAVLYENGPFNIDSAGTLSESAFGWDQYHNMIFVDQPIGTGFSYSEDDRDRVHGEQGVAEDMLQFIYEFLGTHDDLKDRPLFITGESYAGHYVPAVSHRVWEANKAKKGPYIPLQGLAVGNGLTDPGIQFDAYGDFAVQNNLISPTMRRVMSFFMPLCGIANNLCQSTGWAVPCQLGLTYCMATQFQPILAANPNINVYDVTKQCEGRLCYDFSAADEFLNDEKTRDMLGVGDRLWVSCAMDVYEDMSSDWLTKYDQVLPAMMADGIRVMIYAGELDLICNYLGNQRWVDALDWAGNAAWAAAQETAWEVNGVAAGTAKQVGPLSFVRVAKAGHMVPMDQPLNALAMITAWTRNESLARAHHITPLLRAGGSSSSTGSFSGSGMGSGGGRHHIHAPEEAAANAAQGHASSSSSSSGASSSDRSAHGAPRAPAHVRQHAFPASDFVRGVFGAHAEHSDRQEAGLPRHLVR